MTNLVYFSPVPWNSFEQRPHAFVRWYQSRKRGQVLWIDPYPTRLPEHSDVSRLFKLFVHLKNKPAYRQDYPAWLKILRPLALPFEPIPILRSANDLLWRGIRRKIDVFLQNGDALIAAGKPSLLALSVIHQHPEHSSLYDAMDHFPFFYHGLSRSSMTSIEKRFCAAVSHIFISSPAMLKSLSLYKDKTRCVRNACDPDTIVFSTPRMGERPVFGYVGTIGRWFDWRLLIDMAHSTPSALFRVIGPCFVEPHLPLPTNVELKPACSHAEAMLAMAEFSVGLIPFLKNKLTSAVDPIKYYEYRVAGLPVVSTRFGEMANRTDEAGVFFVGQDHSVPQLAKQLTQALLYRHDPLAVENFRHANNWSIRFDVEAYPYLPLDQSKK